MSWTRIINSPGSPVPAGRYAHSMVLVGNSIYLFGGIRSDGNSSELFKLNYDSKTWSLITPSSVCKPSNRSYTAAVSYNDHLYIFGGKSNSGLKNSFFKYSSTRNVWKIVWSTSELERTIANSLPVVPFGPVPDELICPVHNDILIEPVELECKHSFCTSCILNKEVCFTCLKPLNMEEITASFDLCENLQNLKIHCAYGCKLVENKWVVDPTGCPEMLIKRFRSEHERVCKYNKPTCPNSPECIIKCRTDLDRHLRECPFHQCPQKNFGCKFEGQIDSIKKHLVECPYEKLKDLLSDFQKKISLQEQTISSLIEQIKEKDKIISQNNQ